MKIRHALISVSNKTGITELAAALNAAQVKIYSTGGTAAALAAEGLEVTDISTLTGDNEMLGGRVKTLHPSVHGAILADMNDPAHVEELKKRGLPKIDLVVVNFYPFEQAADAAEQVIENIDIGGPTMVRAAAKNYHSTVVLTDPADYPVFTARLINDNGFDLETRRLFAGKAFIAVAHLDAAIANYYSRETSGQAAYPPHQFLHIEKISDLAYGENPHQPAACYRMANVPHGFTPLQGAPLSYNNLLDAHSAWMTASWFNKPAAVIVKHNNPCGIATDHTLTQAFNRALQTDAMSAFGGVVAFNRALEEDVALLLQQSFYEVIIAPQFSAEAKTVLAQKERLRLLISPPHSPPLQQVITCGRMLLLQKSDSINNMTDNDNVVSQRQPTKEELRDLHFAWRAVAAVKSNAIVLAREEATIGIGAGQMSRVDSTRLACEKAQRAKHKTAGSVAASDGFFPFADNIKILAAAGVTAIIQPGGSKNDAEIIATADENDMAMVLTGKRHFRH